MFAQVLTVFSLVEMSARSSGLSEYNSPALFIREKGDPIRDPKTVRLGNKTKNILLFKETDLKSKSLLSFQSFLFCMPAALHLSGCFCYVICKVTCKLS